MDFNRRSAAPFLVLVIVTSLACVKSEYTTTTINGNGRGGADLACGTCPPGSQREQTFGSFYCGRCVPESISCKPGTYLEGNQCLGCPCPGTGTDPSRERASGCQKDNSGQIVCQCNKNYVGRTCDQCAPGCLQRDYFPYDCYQPGESQTCQGQGCSSQNCVGSSCTTCTGSSCQSCTGGNCQSCTGGNCQSCTGGNCQSCSGSNCQSCTGSTCSSSCLGSNCQAPCVGSSCACSGLNCRQPPPPLCDGCGCRGSGCACDSCHFDRHHNHVYHHYHVYSCNQTSSPTDCSIVNNIYNVTNVHNQHHTNVTNVTQQNSIVNNYNYYYTGPEPIVCTEKECVAFQCVCDPRGTVRQDDLSCICKDNVHGASCSRCKKGYFGLEGDNPDGCTSCFCSGLSTECRLKNFFQHYITLRRPHGVQLTDRIENLFPISGDEISFTYDDSSRKDLYWYLPHYFLGARTTSYGGKLSAKRKFTSRGSSISTRSTDVIIISSYGTSIYWTSPEVFAGGVPSMLEVTLDERSGWIIDRHNSSSIATRMDIMEVLADVQKILIRATLADKNRMESTSLSDVTLSTASMDITEQGLVTAIEECDCPSGYQGFSCESCSPGYYRDYRDMSRGVFGACKLCPCGRNSEGCYVQDTEVVCICKSGFTGPKCTDCESLSVNVNPIKCRDCYDALVTFSCSYTTTRTDLAVEFSTIPSWSSLQNYPGASRNGVNFPGRRSGNSLTLTIPLLRKLTKVICTLKDLRTGEIVAEARSTVVGQECLSTPSWKSPGYFNVTPEFLCINTTQTAEFKCHASIPVNWYRARPWTIVRSTPDGTLKFDNYENPVSPTSSGTYVCVGRDGESVFTKKVELLVRDNTMKSHSDRQISTHNQPDVTQSPISHRPAIQPPVQDRWPDSKNDVISKPEDSDSDSDDYEWNDSPTLNPQTPDSPKVYIYPTVQRVPLGQQARFKCTATGDSTRIYWQTESGQDLSSSTDGVLTFSAVSKSDEKNYICIGISAGGKSIAKSSLVVLDSTFGLTITSTPPAHLAQIGQQLVVSCDSRDRVMEIRWQKENGVLPSNSVQYPNGSLIIAAVKPTDAGTYVCYGSSNSGEPVTAKLLLTVKQLSNTTFVAPKVNIRPATNPLIIQAGENLRIHCQATGEPIPKLTWSRHMISPGGNSGFERKLVEVQTSPAIATYEITDASSDSAGNYTCTARSAAGVSQATTTIVVASRDNHRRHHRQRN